jgi:hypothetical protein
MKSDLVISALRQEAARFEECMPGAAWYLYGSTLVDGASTADIDVLIVYPAGQDPIVIRRNLEALCLSLPIHLFLATRDEERELGFITAQGCVRVYPGPTHERVRLTKQLGHPPNS